MPTATGRDARELLQLRDSCWRMSHELESLHDTIAILRAGANSLAIDNALLRVENERLRSSLRGATTTSR